MRWSEERYVKLFSRDTPTWLSWPWEARALLPLLLRKLDGAGLLEVGRLDVNRAVAISTGLPESVAAVGIKALLADGTLEATQTGLLMPNFEEAQESTKSDALRKRDQRQRARDQARAPNPLDSGDSLSRGVTGCHGVSRAVPLQPSPPQPTPPTTTSVADATIDALLQEPKPPDTAEDVFEHWKEKTQSPRSVLDKKRRKLIGARVREGYAPQELKLAVDGYCASPFHQGQNDRSQKYLSLELMLRDAEHVDAGLKLLERPVLKLPSKGQATAADTDWSNAQPGDFLKGLVGG